jgi:Gpi18-like mannosyltransferase
MVRISPCAIDFCCFPARSYLCISPFDVRLIRQVVHQIYRIASPLPQLDCIFFLLTIRARNLFQNGLFNDPLQTLFSYLGVLFLFKRRFKVSLTFFSLGASVKMSGLLWAPGVAAYLVSSIGLLETVKSAWSGVLLQVLVALPFRSHLWNYIHYSFELDKRFTWFNVLTIFLTFLTHRH